MKNERGRMNRILRIACHHLKYEFQEANDGPPEIGWLVFWDNNIGIIIKADTVARELIALEYNENKELKRTQMNFNDKRILGYGAPVLSGVPEYKV